ncbi:hypothetical protein [Luteolibacter soli]|uniref:Uncharacterized protein n=1 Tax=Luteolibacter soli TaxID=3135280 RepID=A0ABU9AVS0_9BACT
MKIATLVAIGVMAAMPSCRRSSTPPVSLKMGDTMESFEVGARWSDTQDRLVAALLPLWDGTPRGVSAEFQMTRTIPREVSPSRSGTWSSPKWRFFRDRNGRSGIEQMEDSGPAEMISEPTVEWRQVEAYLKSQLLEASRVGGTGGEQNGGGQSATSPGPK